MIRLGLWISVEERSQRQRANVHYMLSKVYAINVTVTVEADLDHLAEVVSVRFVQCKDTFPQLSIPFSWERSHCVQPTLKGWGEEGARE